MEIFQYLFLLIFSNRSMYMNLLTGRNTPAFAKDTLYRFMKMTHINWIRFTTVLSSRIIKEAITPLDSEDRAKHAFKFGFRMLTLGWSDGSTFLPVSGVLLSSENKGDRINEASAMDKRTVGHKRRQLSMRKGTSVMLELLKQAKNAAIPAKYVLFDSWFSSPSSIHAVCIWVKNVKPSHIMQ